MQLTVKQPAPHAARLAAVRRLYVYLVAFVSLAAGLAAIASLLEILSRLWLEPGGQDLVGGADYARSVAGSAGLLLVAAPIFLIHWALAQAHRQEEDERASLLRKLFLYGATALSLIGMLVNVFRLLKGLAQLALGVPPQATDLLPSQWFAWTLVAAANGALLSYWYAILRADGDYAVEKGPARFVRQLFLAIGGLVGLLVLLWGAASVIRLALNLFADRVAVLIGSAWWQTALSEALAQALVGGWLVHAIWMQWQAVMREHPAEGQAALRRFYLYVAVVLGAVATLTPAALVLREGLLILFGSSTGNLADLLYKLIDPLAFVPVGLAIWLWHWQVLRREAEAYGESRQGANVRRLYYYLVAAIGLAVTWVGAVEVLHALLDVWLANESTVGRIWTEPLATGLSMLAVGAPVWALHWQAVQRVARQRDEAGRAERGSLPRKIYLYGVALVGALVILFELAQVVYRLLLMAMGDPSAELFSSQTAQQLADCLVAAVLWTVHLLAIRGDTQLEERDTAASLQASISDPEQQRADLRARVARLEAELAAAQAQLAALEEVQPSEPP